MKGKAHLKCLQLLQLNKCGWMIISFPSRNKRKKEGERETAALNNHTIKTIKSDFEVGLASKSQQYICWRNGVLGSADRRRWTAVSWAMGSASILFHCGRAAIGLLRTLLASSHPRSWVRTATVLSRPSKTCPAIPPRRQKSAECVPDVASARART